MSNQEVLSQPEKFYAVFKGLFEAMEIVIGDLNAAGKTTLNVGNVSLVRNFIMGLDRGYHIKTFIETSEQHWDKINNKDDDFFVKNSGEIFGKYAKMEEFNALKVIFGKNSDGTDIVDSQTKDDVR